MLAITALVYGLFLGRTLAHSVKRWTNGGLATGKTDPNVVADCDYWANVIESGDTCESLESHFGLTAAQLATWNPLLSGNCTLNIGWSYCVDAPYTTTILRISSPSPATAASKIMVPTTFVTSTTSTADHAPSPTQTGLISSCNAYYLVKPGDTCYGIQSQFGNFTLAQFYTWNPAVKTDCSDLEAGYYACIGISLGQSTTSVITTATATSTSTSGPIPTQTGITNKCDKYYQVVSGDTCAGIASNYDISLSQFYDWNPAVGNSCTDLLAGYYVCVGVVGMSLQKRSKRRKRNAEDKERTRKNYFIGQPTYSQTMTTATATSAGPLPTQSGIISSCTSYYQAKTGDTCSSIVTGHYSYLTVDEFEKWNPAVGTNCGNLLPGYYYCVATSSVEPEPGTIKTCTSYHLVVSGDTCYSIEQKFGISTANFQSWNPGVGSSCSSLWAGYYVCVGV
ncbi:LysM domain protein [Talaromyces proteolyticus]|uniref:LysM domain protein n=1 Tax=Talaromyces proteolyticus TaxID=1131652 RepID=A0AAD4PWN0_9EURO|nr:LysM domain protein [Talaromyces proteolyticus]KAH8692157.1 LysM domain protein [Talaromyces proteolyticus]